MNDEFDIPQTDEGELAHYGTPRHSGRYPWGSGKNPHQHQDERSLLRRTYKQNKNFLEKVNSMMREGVEEKEIAKAMGCRTTGELRAKRKAATNTNKKIDIAEIDRLLKKGYSKAEISRRTELPYSTVVSLMNPKTQENVNKYTQTMDLLKSEVAKKKYVYVGIGAENQLGITPDHLEKALGELKMHGYAVETISAEQVNNPTQMTHVRVLAPPGEDLKSISRNRQLIKPIVDSPYANDDARIFGIERPAALDSKRIYIRYPDDPTGNGAEMDGVIQIRRGVDDLYLGPDTTYAQVRINVDDKSYLKGMAIYGGENDIPDGYDVVFNVSKKRGADYYTKVLKPLKLIDDHDPSLGIDWDNPFGATIKPKEQGGQMHYKDPETGEMKLSLINKVNTEGDWDDWSITLSSQFLSKQPVKLIKQQLDKTFDERTKEYQALIDIPDGPIKEKLLRDFADNCDAAAVHLKAAGFSGQGQKVILPINTLKEGEVYAPAYPNGTKLILVRHPHQGTFEIPLVTVNNDNPKGKEVLGNVQDAIGIRSETATQLSGADYDGDTVTCIPVNDKVGDFNIGEIQKELQFDPKSIYAKGPDDPKTGEKKEKDGRIFVKGRQMGSVSNLITDMTIKEAPLPDIVKATKHALVVIDAEKHNLDWVQSEIDNDIAELRKKYQGKKGGGASTLISRASAEARIPEISNFVRESDIDPETGEIIPRPTGRTKINKQGKEYEVETKTTKMAIHKDARELMSDPASGYPQEELYAKYANDCKALANKARKNSLKMGYSQNPSAAETYAKEVASLNAKLNTAIKNKPYESLANIKAAAVVAEKKKHLPANLSKEDREKEIKKIRTQAIRAARDYYGARGGDSKIPMTDREWEAIMAGAFSKNKVKQILDNTKSDVIKQYAMPRETFVVSPGLRSLVLTMNAINADNPEKPRYTLADISERTGLSTSTISNIIRNKI